jgi:polyisoprenoid-binding protein YceI
MANTKITVLDNGPLLVEGEIELKDQSGNAIPVSGQPCALCRCGLSKNKPFCDGSHAKAGPAAGTTLLALLAVSLFSLSPAVAADGWSLDPTHSQASFSVRHMMVSNVRGSFSKLQGKALYDGKDLKSASVEANVDVASIDTHDEKRDGHLKSPDFFDAAKYPEIKFVSKKFSPTKAGFDIQGDLTLHGVTKPVVLHAEKLSQPVKDPYGNLRIGTVATTQVNRKDYGMTYNQQLDNGGVMVGDQVAIELDIELVKNKG